MQVLTEELITEENKEMIEMLVDHRMERLIDSGFIEIPFGKPTCL